MNRREPQSVPDAAASTGYDARRGGVQRVHDHTQSRCWAWAHATARRSMAAHISAGGPVWWRPDAGLRRYAGITEWRAGWLLLAVQVATRPHPHPHSVA